MGSSYNTEKETRMKIMKVWIAYFGLFLISMMGALILLFWEIKYHPSNKQLWMVPFGLIMFLTPVLVCFAAFISDTFAPIASSDHTSSLKLQPVVFSQVNAHSPPSQHV